MAPSAATGGVPTLIDCWHVRDLQRFRAVLKGGPAAAGLPANHASSSYSKSPSHSSYQGGASWGSHGSVGGLQYGHGPAAPSEVNRKDHFGRTALHHVASSEEGVSIDFLHALLSHPSCNPNVQDAESGWTALHRALYLGNLNHALTLLRHSNIDVRVKDFENLSPFDLYNSTVAGTNPPVDGEIRGDLYLWGSNCNYTLGLGDGDDRAFPDLVTLPRHEASSSMRSSSFPGQATSPHSDGEDEDHDGDDATHREAQSRSLAAPGRRFDRIRVLDVQMSRLHTVVITDEKNVNGNNVWVAGVGSGGRLGRAAATQSVLTPLADLRDTIVEATVGPDHTLLISTNGSVYSFGSNRWGVLGFTLEEGQGQVASSGGSASVAASATFGGGSGGSGNSGATKNLDIQVTPRKIMGPFKKEAVIGVAASKLHSIAYTSDSLYTWGSNTGQLGYDKVATPVQVLPRKVTTLTGAQSTGIRQATCSDHATAVLLSSFDVLLFHGDTNFRIQFPMARFNERMSAGVFRPPQAQPKPSISKLTSAGNTFAALSDYGDLFTFNVEHPSEFARGAASAGSGSKRVPAPEPQLVWSVRKKFTAVRDVAIGLDGSIILSTTSGHVFVRSRRAAGDAKSSSKSGSARAFKFVQIPYLQRVVKVATNEGGGFAAIRSQAPIRDIRVKGRNLDEDLLEQLPHLRASSGAGEDRQISTDVATARYREADHSSASEDESEEEDTGAGVADQHVASAWLLAEAAKRWERRENPYGPANLTPPYGCDMFLIAGSRYLPVHRAVLSARLPLLRALLEDPPTKGAGGAPNGIVVKKVNEEVTTLTLPSCNFHTALFLLHYLYTDHLPAVWTASVAVRVEKQLAAIKLNRNQVHTQLKELAKVLGLSALTPILSSPQPRAVQASLSDDLRSFYTSAVLPKKSLAASPLHDIELILADRQVPAHSVLLRRSPFFAALLQPDWTSSRWSDGKLQIDLSNLRWENLSIHLRHLYTDDCIQAFRGKDVDLSIDGWIDFLTEALAASNELLLDKLKLTASALLRSRIAPQNISAILTIADTYHAVALKEASLLYCAQNLESLLEGGMLEELEHKMVRELATFIKAKQDEKMRRTLRAFEVSELVVKHNEYAESLDLPPPSLNLVSQRVGKRPPRTTPLVDRGSKRKSKSQTARQSSSPPTSPSVQPLAGNESALFDMDEEFDGDQLGEATTASLGAMANLSLSSGRKSSSPAPAPWTTVGRTADGVSKEPAGRGAPSPMNGTGDLRSIMAAEQARMSGQSTPRSQPLRRLPSSVQTPEPSRPASASGFNTPSRLSAPDPSPAALPSQDEPSAALPFTAKLSQKDRKRQQQQQQQQQAQTAAAEAQHAAAEAARLEATPAAPAWKLPAASTAAPQGAPLAQTPVRPSWQMAHQKSSGARDASQEGSSSNVRSPVLGPTYTPTKAATTTSRPSLGQITRTPSEMAWASTSSNVASSPGVTRTPSAQTPVRPSLAGPKAHPSQNSTSPFTSSYPALSPPAIPPLPSTSPSAAGSLSFAQIQAQQEAASTNAALESAASSRKSFAQIQEEERKREQERQQQEKERLEFEKWFEEESRKVKQEEQRQSGKREGGPSSGGKKSGGGGGGGAQSKKKKGGANTQGSGGNEANGASAARSNGHQSGGGGKKKGGERTGKARTGHQDGGSHPDAPKGPKRTSSTQQEQQQQHRQSNSGGDSQRRGSRPPPNAPSSSSSSRSAPPQQIPSDAGLSAAAPVFRPSG
ncbi:unnamed protein product [Jaminaea pallidilutea]